MQRFLLLKLIFLFIAISAYPQFIYTVDRLSDNNTLTGEGLGDSGDLRYCLSKAGENAESTINFEVEGIIYLSDSIPSIKNKIKIDAEDKNIIIDGQNQFRIFTFSTGSEANIRRINMYNGYAKYPSFGGGAILNAGNLTLEGCNFAQNQSEDGGGAITNLQNGKISVTKCLFSRNRATSFGGGMNNFGGNITVRGCSFEQDTSAGSGGGIADFGESVIANTIFLENGSYFGGAAYSGGNDAINHHIYNCIFYNNGGNNATAIPAIYNASMLVMINNSIYSYNGGGIFIDNAFSNFVSLSIINNIVAVENTENMSLEGSILGVAFNNIIFGITNSNISDGVNGNSISNSIPEPLFYSTENQFYQSKLSLAAYSSAIDAALISITGFSIPQNDINDSLRDVNPDIGAIEFRTLEQTISFEPIEDKTFLDAPFEIIATVPSQLKLNFLVSGGAISVGKYVSITGAGVITITAFVWADRYYKATSDTIFINVGKAYQFIPIIGNLTDLTLTGQNMVISLSGIANSGLEVNYKLQTDTLGKTATISGNILNIFGAGMVTITGTQDGNENYNPAFQSVSFQVLKLNYISGIDTSTGVNTLTGSNTATRINEDGFSTSISVYPNPTNGEFFISTSSPTWLEIYTLFGIKIEKIYILKALHVKLEPKGLYLLRFSIEGKSIYRKIVVE